MDDPDSTYSVLGSLTFGADDEDYFGLLRDDRENNPQEETTQELAQVSSVNVTEELHHVPDFVGVVTSGLGQDPAVNFVIPEQHHAATDLSRGASLELAQVSPVNVAEELHHDPDPVGTLDLAQAPAVYVIPEQRQRRATTDHARDASSSNMRKRKFPGEEEEGELNDTLSSQQSRRRDEPSAEQRQTWRNEKYRNQPLHSFGMQQRRRSRGCPIIEQAIVASIHGGIPRMQAPGPYQYNFSRPFPYAAPQNTYHQLPVANRIHEPWRLPNTSQQHPVRTNQMANLASRQTMMPMQDPMMYPYQHPVANQQNLYQHLTANEQNLYQHPVANQQNLYQHPVANQKNLYQHPVANQQNLYQHPVANQQNLYDLHTMANQQNLYDQQPMTNEQNLYDQHPMANEQNLYDQHPVANQQNLYQHPVANQQNLYDQHLMANQQNLSDQQPMTNQQNLYDQHPMANEKNLYQHQVDNQKNLYQHPVANQQNLYQHTVANQQNLYDQHPVANQQNLYDQHPVANQQNMYDQHPMANEQNLYQHLMASPPRMPQFRNDKVYTTSTIPPPRGQPRPVAIGQNYLNTQPQQPRAEVNHQQLQQRVPRQSQGPSSEQGGDQQQQPR